MSSARPVPRHIDAPNRVPEFAIAWFTCFHFFNIIFDGPGMGAMIGFLAVYIMYKYTIDKPEGLAFRWMYRHMAFGKMRPPPHAAPRFDI